MQNQPITQAMSTQDVVAALNHSDADGEGRMTRRDGLTMLLQAASATGLCLLVNLIAV